MNNKELYQICLDERNAKQELLRKEIEELEIQHRKASFEENMYYRLAESRHKYGEILRERREASENQIKKLEGKINELKEKLKLLEMEIEYIESLLA